MIRLARPPEPEPLRRKRPGKVAAARAALDRGEKTSPKPEEQARYCEAEHYRPKSTYRWLTWTWDNLLVACMDCNRDHKEGTVPTLGRVGRQITLITISIGTGVLSYSVDYIEHVITHEIGHTIGLGHTDGGGSLCLFILGSPTTDPNSVFNSTFTASATGEFSSADVNVLNLLY